MLVHVLDSSLAELRRGSASLEELTNQLFPAKSVVLAHVGKDAGQSPGAERAMPRDRDVMLAAEAGSKAKVGARLARDLVAKHSESRGQVLA